VVLAARVEAIVAALTAHAMLCLAMGTAFHTFGMAIRAASCWLTENEIHKLHSMAGSANSARHANLNDIGTDAGCVSTEGTPHVTGRQHVLPPDSLKCDVSMCNDVELSENYNTPSVEAGTVVIAKVSYYVSFAGRCELSHRHDTYGLGVDTFADCADITKTLHTRSTQIQLIIDGLCLEEGQLHDVLWTNDFRQLPVAYWGRLFARFPAAARPFDIDFARHIGLVKYKFLQTKVAKSRYNSDYTRFTKISNESDDEGFDNGSENLRALQLLNSHFGIDSDDLLDDDSLGEHSYDF